MKLSEWAAPPLLSLPSQRILPRLISNGGALGEQHREFSTPSVAVTRRRTPPRTGRASNPSFDHNSKATGSAFRRSHSIANALTYKINRLENSASTRPILQNKPPFCEENHRNEHLNPMHDSFNFIYWLLKPFIILNARFIGQDANGSKN